MENTFAIKVGEFEGPLDLLLQLIEKKKLHISNINITKVADDYIAHISTFEHLPKNEVADFLVIASTLMLIKSASLLPNLKLSIEEEQNASDLEYRLKVYQHMQEASLKIKDLFNQQPIFFREESKNTLVVFSPTAELSTANLYQTILTLLKNLPPVVNIPQVVVKTVISLQEAIDKLTDRIQSALSMKFSDFAPRDKAERVNIIVSFLGMLELVKQGIINVRQDNPFNDIDMETTSTTTPRY